MGRQTRQCLGCDGRTRHADQRCSSCRRLRRQLPKFLLHGETRAWFLPTLPGDSSAPTARELSAHGRRIEAQLLPTLTYRGRAG